MWSGCGPIGHRPIGNRPIGNRGMLAQPGAPGRGRSGAGERSGWSEVQGRLTCRSSVSGVWVRRMRGRIVAYDDGLAARVDDVLRDEADLVAKKMFGGIAFLLEGHMCAGVVGNTLMLRIGPDAYEAALTEEYVKPMDFTGKPMFRMSELIFK